MRKKHSNVQYVDDAVLVSDTRDGLQEIVTAAKIESEKAGLGMNVKKTTTIINKTRFKHPGK